MLKKIPFFLQCYLRQGMKKATDNGNALVICRKVYIEPVYINQIVNVMPPKQSIFVDRILSVLFLNLFQELLYLLHSLFALGRLETMTGTRDDVQTGILIGLDGTARIVH